MRSKALLILGLVLILGFVNIQIFRHERDLAQGARLVLKLQPRDPRSLMQGDYMRLNYDLANQITDATNREFVFLKPGRHGLATEPLFHEAPGTVKLRYRVHDHQVLFDIESFFFQEGEASKYERARYVELRVTPAGIPRIVHLLDENFQVI